MGVITPWGVVRHAAPSLSGLELSAVYTQKFPRPSGEGRRKSFTVTSWNIDYGRRYEKIRRALTTVLQSEIIMLQEVDRMTNRTRDRRSKEPLDLPLVLGESLQMSFAYGVEFQELKQDGRNRPAFTGQQTLSVFPLSRPETVRFESQLADWSRGWLGFWQKRRGGRMFLYCQALVGDVRVHLYNAHLESRASDRDKLHQVREILAHVQARCAPREPVIIAGDLNTRQSERSPVARSIAKAGFTDSVARHSSGKLHTNYRGDRRLDWIFSRNLSSIGARVSARFLGSDHRAVSATYLKP